MCDHVMLVQHDASQWQAHEPMTYHPCHIQVTGAQHRRQLHCCLTHCSARAATHPPTSPATPPSCCVQQVSSALASWFLKHCGDVPMSSVEHPDLVRAFALLGVPLPGAKALLGPVLQQSYIELQVKVDEVLRGQKVRAEKLASSLHGLLLLPAGVGGVVASGYCSIHCPPS
jgi:hypothetical protein